MAGTVSGEASAQNSGLRFPSVPARRATKDDAATIAGALASAFGEDPVFRWMSAVDDCERRTLPFWRNVARSGLRHDDHEIYVSDDGHTAAVWRGIDNWKVPMLELVRSAPSMLFTLRTRLPLAMQLLSTMEKQHPTEPHYYLEFLGTRRGHQNRGGGTAVLQPMLDRCDAEGVPAYLESSNARNVPFYARHGFVERGTVTAPKGGPTLTLMWREPRG
jgi:GNAT superfamily N-acetyltransferase